MGWKIHKLDVNAAESRLDAVAKMLIRPGVVHTCRRVVSCFHPFAWFPGKKQGVGNLTKPKRLCYADDLFLSLTVVTLTPAPFLHTCDLGPHASPPLSQGASGSSCICRICLFAADVPADLPDWCSAAGCGWGHKSLLSAPPLKMRGFYPYFLSLHKNELFKFGPG